MRYAARVDAKIDGRSCKPKLGYRLVCVVCNESFRAISRTKYCINHKEEAKANQVAKIKLGKKSDPLSKVKKICPVCKASFEHYRSTNRIYCSYKCHLESGGAWRAGMASAGARMRYGAKKDANHNEVVAALQQVGASVIDMSHVGKGFPDLIVGFRSQTILVEIKNPKTSYGKRGLNKNQQKWKEQWVGGPYCIVDSPEAALRAIGAIS